MRSGFLSHASRGHRRWIFQSSVALFIYLTLTSALSRGVLFVVMPHASRRLSRHAILGFDRGQFPLDRLRLRTTAFLRIGYLVGIDCRTMSRVRRQDPGNTTRTRVLLGTTPPLLGVTYDLQGCGNNNDYISCSFLFLLWNRDFCDDPFEKSSRQLVPSKYPSVVFFFLRLALNIDIGLSNSVAEAREQEHVREVKTRRISAGCVIFVRRYLRITRGVEL